MKVEIKRIDVGLPMPQYHTEGAVAFDMYSRVTTKIMSGEIARISSNFVVKTPVGHVLQISLRSGAPKKYPGLVVPHGVGLIDQDFCGPEDEVLIQVLNTSKETIVIEKGERFAQAMFIKIEKPEFKEIKELETASRGGFGSTD